MKVVTLDIETITPDWKEEGFEPIPYHRPVAICWRLDGWGGAVDGMRARRIHSEDDESKALDDFFRTLAKADRLVTWNGRGFDMPVLELRAVARGVRISPWTQRRGRFDRWKDPLFHWDMLEQLTNFGACRRYKLDECAKAIGLEGKVGVGGESVGDAWAAGRFDEVEAYCRNDVDLTWAIYQRWLSVI